MGPLNSRWCSSRHSHAAKPQARQSQHLALSGGQTCHAASVRLQLLLRVLPQPQHHAHRHFSNDPCRNCQRAARSSRRALNSSLCSGQKPSG